MNKSGTTREETKSLPNGWRWVRLGDVCEVNSVQVLPSTDAARELPYIGLEHIESGTGRIMEKVKDTDSRPVQSTAFRFSPQHLLYGKLRPYLNKVATPDFEGRCTTELLPLLPSGGCDRDYLAWLLRRNETVEEAMRHKTGTRMPRADMDELFKMLVPLPPLPEQKRIALKIQGLSQEVERARTACEKQLEAAKALPAAYLREVFESEEAKRWERKKLGEVCEFLDSMRIPVNDAERQKRIAGKKQSDLYPYYGANGQIGWIDGYLFDEDLVLLAEDGGFFGSFEKPIAYRVSGKYWVNNHAHVLRAKKDIIDVDWLYFTLAIRPDVIQFASGTTRLKVNQEQASLIPITLPSLPEQRRIAAELKAKMAKAEKLRTSIERQLDAINALLQAILRKAFRGELV